MLQVLASIGNPDFTSHLSWAAFAVSLPCAAGFLYLRFLQDENEGYNYSPVHEKLAFISVMAGALSAIALVWHFWYVAGIILLTASLLIFVIGALSKIFMNEEYYNTVNTILTEIANDSQENEQKK